jgi:hypothetical protein
VTGVIPRAGVRELAVGVRTGVELEDRSRRGNDGLFSHWMTVNSVRNVRLNRQMLDRRRRQLRRSGGFHMLLGVSNVINRVLRMGMVINVVLCMSAMIKLMFRVSRVINVPLGRSTLIGCVRRFGGRMPFAGGGVSRREMLRVPVVRGPKTFGKTIFHANSLSENADAPASPTQMIRPRIA